MSEYKKSLYKEVEAGGFKWLIRKIPISALVEMTELYKKNPTEEEATQLLPKLIRILLPACVVEPKVVEQPMSENEIGIDEIDAKTALDLVTAITNHSGITGEVAKFPREAVA